MHARIWLVVGAIFVAAHVMGCGSGGSGAGEVPGSRMSLAAAQSGCVTVCPTCKPGVACPQFCRIDCPPGVSPCGPTVCRHNEECCNESCGICTRPGESCTQQACAPATPCVDTVLCIRGFHWSPDECQCVPDQPCVDTVLCARGLHWSPAECQCVPDEPCVDTVLCIRGTHWSPRLCECVPNGSCDVDQDCRLFSDYCTGCDCRALSNDDADPVCSGPGAECLADPCMGRSVQCVSGQCVVSAQCVQTQLCARRTHWSPEQCACVPDHGPHTPHRPHAPHAPHSPQHTGA